MVVTLGVASLLVVFLRTVPHTMSLHPFLPTPRPVKPPHTPIPKLQPRKHKRQPLIPTSSSIMPYVTKEEWVQCLKSLGEDPPKSWTVTQLKVRYEELQTANHEAEGNDLQAALNKEMKRANRGKKSEFLTFLQKEGVTYGTTDAMVQLAAKAEQQITERHEVSGTEQMGFGIRGSDNEGGDGRIPQLQGMVPHHHVGREEHVLEAAKIRPVHRETPGSPTLQGAPGEPGRNDSGKGQHQEDGHDSESDQGRSVGWLHQESEELHRGRIRDLRERREFRNGQCELGSRSQRDGGNSETADGVGGNPGGENGPGASGGTPEDEEGNVTSMDGETALARSGSLRGILTARSGRRW